MASDDREFTHESLQDRKSIIKYLSALSEAFQQGKLQLSRDSETFAMEPPELVKFDLRAKQKGGSAQIVLKFSWKKQKKAKTLRVEPLVIEGERAES